VDVAVATLARHDGFGVILKGEPKLVPSRAFTVASGHGVDLLQGSISELEDVDHADDLASIIHHRKIEIMPILQNQ